MSTTKFTVEITTATNTRIDAMSDRRENDNPGSVESASQSQQEPVAEKHSSKIDIADLLPKDLWAELFSPEEQASAIAAMELELEEIDENNMNDCVKTGHEDSEELDPPTIFSLDVRFFGAIRI